MSKCRMLFAGVLFLACLTLAGAEKFQVSFLTDATEPKVKKAVKLEAVAELFAERLSKTLRKEIKVVPFEKADAETIFLITREKVAGGEYAHILKGLPLDSFIIRYPVTIKGKKNVCLLMGRDAFGYSYPCNFFLRKYLGVDMVFPTADIGYVFPDNSKWNMPAKVCEKESPAFNTRAWTMNRVIDKEFARMSLGESRRNISWHTFGRVISPKKYGKTHPEYFPLVRGKRYNQPIKDRCDWSPCVSNPEVQKLMVDYLLRGYGNDGSDAVELAVNDGSGRHCECAGCTAWDNPAEKVRGFYSNRYFTFYKKVLTAAQKVNPDVKACILLYSDATTLVPTKVDIHPGLVGMSTRENTIRNFAKAGMKRLGLWEHQLDYLYPLPRHYPQAMKAKLREMHSIGVREYFGEVYMIAAANLPKQYILARLLWNLDTDVVKVLEEFCLKAYGPQAGPFMKRYYDTWEKIYNQECAARQGKPKARLMAYTVEWFAGVRSEDVKTLETALINAEKSKMSDHERKRFEYVKNHFAYIRCLMENYLDAQALRKGVYSVEEISKIHQRTLARDAAFMNIWKNLVSKDDMGFYRRSVTGKNRKKVDIVSGLYRNAVKSYLHESMELALHNHQNKFCAAMKQPARLQYWKDAFKKYPSILPIAIMIGENAGTKLPDFIQDGQFKKGVPGNPAVKGLHPKMEHWFFYDQMGDVLSDEYKNCWKLVVNAKGSNQLGFGEGKYPEMRQYMYLTAGVYRLSFRRSGPNTMSFNLYEVPNLHNGAFKDLMTLRSYRVRTPALFSCNNLPAEGVSSVKQTVLIDKEGWYVLYIATPTRTPKSWDYLMDVKMEKLAN